MKSRLSIILVFMLVALSGCVSLDPSPDWDRTSREVESAVGVTEQYRPEDDALIQERVDQFAQDGLTVREAIQVCLLNNPRLQSEMLKVGIARADFVQSHLLSNPSFSFAPRWPDGGGLSNLQFGMAQNVAELWQIPFRKIAAERDLDRTVLEAAREASVTAQLAVLAYYRVLHAERSAQLIEENATLTQRLVDLAAGRRDAGAGSDLDIDLAKAQRAEVTLRSRQRLLEVVETRTELVRLLGIQASPETLRLLDSLPQPALVALSPQHVIETARLARLDLRASVMAVDAAAARIDFENSRVLKVLEFGVSVERNAQWSKSRGRDGLALEGSAEITGNGLDPAASIVPQERSSQQNEWVVGPSLTLEVPIFDQNQAQIAKAKFIHRQATKLVQAIESDVSRGAYVACARLKTAADNARLYVEEIIPLRERVLSLGEDAYRAGRTSFLAVVQSQQSLQDARAGYIDALRDYASAIVEVEGVAGCPYQRLVESPVASRIVDSNSLAPLAPTSMPAETQQ